jgi:phosphopantetheine--protein transferase-like protein
MTSRLAIGVDVVSIDRWRRASEASAIADGILTDNERERSLAAQAQAFAVKEAAIKALRSSIAMNNLRDIEASAAGLRLRGRALAEARRKGLTRWHHSSARVGDFAVALVIAEHERDTD